MAAPAPEMPAQTAIALARSRAGNTLARIDSVDGMTNAAPTPMTAREAISRPDVSANTPSSEPSPKITRPACKRALAAEAVAERGGGEQQAGEHEPVGVDDPLDVGVRRPDAAVGWPASAASAGPR